MHIVTEGPLGWSALAAANKLKLPCSSDFHTNFHNYSEHYGVGWLKGSIARYLRQFHNKADCTMVPTRAMQADLERCGYRNLRVIARGVDTVQFTPERRSAELRTSWGVSPNQTVAIYVGRLAAEKNISIVLRAYDAMKAANANVKLVLVGDGPERAALEASRRDVIFAGLRTGTDLAAHYASADVFLFPSVTETFGNVTVEAMASGLAVVAYGYAAAAEYIRHRENGLIAEFGNAWEFVQQAASLANDAQRISNIGNAARATALDLDWEKVYAPFEAALQDSVFNNDRLEDIKRLSA